MFSADQLPKRKGVELLDLAGLGDWPVPVALWNAPSGFDTRTHPDNQPCNVIALRLSGSLVQRVDEGAGRLERLHPNGFSVHPARHALRFVAPSAILFAHLYVTETFFRNVLSKTSSPSVAPDRVIRDDRVMYEDDELTLAIDSYVKRAFDHQDRPTKFEMESRANLIALRLLNRHCSGMQDALKPSGSQMAPWQVRRICTYLEQNLCRTVGLDELSKLVGLSIGHMSRAFRRATGVPPLRWQIQKRMEVACGLLVQSDASLISIAQDVGYTGQSAFGAAFREIIGLSPGQYRRMTRGESGNDCERVLLRNRQKAPER